MEGGTNPPSTGGFAECGVTSAIIDRKPPILDSRSGTARSDRVENFIRG